MAKTKLIFYSLLLVLVVAVFGFRGGIYEYFRPAIEQKIAEVEKAAIDAFVRGLKDRAEIILTIEEPTIQSPPPLRADALDSSPPLSSGQVSQLSVLGTIVWTNTERAKSGLAALQENALLNLIAELRLRDMFEKQYFAHVSPTGEEVKTVAARAGYEYILLGENLALGNFENDQTLVQAWMDSPGHRANILGERYAEIGVAVERGMFEGRNVWLAVQIFGRPLALCPLPSEALKAQIEILREELDTRQKELEEREEEIRRMNRRSPEYREKVDEYNALVAEYNSAVERLKMMVADYNIQVAAFNECLAR